MVGLAGLCVCLLVDFILAFWSLWLSVSIYVWSKVTYPPLPHYLARILSFPHPPHNNLYVITTTSCLSLWTSCLSITLNCYYIRLVMRMFENWLKVLLINSPKFEVKSSWFCILFCGKMPGKISNHFQLNSIENAEKHKPFGNIFDSLDTSKSSKLYSTPKLAR